MIEMWNIVNKEFKTAIINMLKEMTVKMNKKMEYFNRKLESIKIIQ